MATYHLRVKAVSRSAGRSATAAAAYRSGTKIRCEREQRVHDYRRRSGVVSRELLFPNGAQWSRQADREAVWNAAEAAEVRKNATVAREYEVAIPAELSPAERRALVAAFAQEICDRHQVIADIAIHAPNAEGDQRNWHAHILTTTRRVTPDGLGEKTRELDDREQGPKTVTLWRERWEALANRSLARENHSERISCRSLQAQRETMLTMAEATVDPVKAEAYRIEAAALNREAEPHMGPRATAMERKARREAAEKGEEYTPVTEVGKAAAEAAADRHFAAEMLAAAQQTFNEYWLAVAKAAQPVVNRVKRGWNALQRLRSGEEGPPAVAPQPPPAAPQTPSRAPEREPAPEAHRQVKSQTRARTPKAERHLSPSEAAMIAADKFDALADIAAPDDAARLRQQAQEMRHLAAASVNAPEAARAPERKTEPTPAVERPRTPEPSPEIEDGPGIENTRQTPEKPKPRVRATMTPHFVADLSRQIAAAKRDYEAAKDAPDIDTVDVKKLYLAHQRLSDPQLMQAARERDDQLRLAHQPEREREAGQHDPAAVREAARIALRQGLERGAPETEIEALRANYRAAMNPPRDAQKGREEELEL